MLGFFKKKLKDAFDNVKKEEEDMEEEVTEGVVAEQSILAPEEEKEKEPVKEPREIKQLEPGDVYVEEDREELEQSDEIEPEEQAFVEGYEKAEEEVVSFVEEEPEKKKGFLKKVTDKITHKRINQKQFDKLFWNLEMAMLESNVAMEVIEKIKQDLTVDVVDVSLRGKVEDALRISLRESVDDVLSFEVPSLLQLIKNKKDEKYGPFVILFVGVNGSGKTTTIAKVANYLKEQDKTSVLVAADTFRAAAIEQLEHHGKTLEIPVIKQSYGSDPAAVAFDGVKYGKAKSLDAVLIDTAGRQQSNANLMAELKKIRKVSEPDLTIFIGESTAGSDCITQVKEFNSAAKIDGLILSKADVDEKGGVALSVSHVSQKPILFLGIGQDYKDLEIFDKDKILENLGL